MDFCEELWYSFDIGIERKNQDLAGGILMNKLHLWSIIFIVIAAIAFIPLTAEIFGYMNTDIIIVTASVFGVGLLGSCICNIIRVVRNYELKKK
ncbi:MAG: hypothetical protein NC302_04435 [Bacteroidales bacterium]|nr:hypothetical protein [Bacteroidales bacterium]